MFLMSKVQKFDNILLIGTYYIDNFFSFFFASQCMQYLHQWQHSLNFTHLCITSACLCMHRHVIVIPPNSLFFFSFLDCIHTGQDIRKALLISLINVASLGFKKLCFFFFTNYRMAYGGGPQ